MTDLEMFRAFLSQAGLDGQERPLQKLRSTEPGPWEWDDIPGSVFFLNWRSDEERWGSYDETQFFLKFDGDGKLISFGAVEE